MAESKRVKWIDGIKGVACLLILAHHWFLGKFPASYFGDAKESLCNGHDVFFSQSILSFLVTGNFFVHLYILITGFVVALQIKKMEDEKGKFFPFSIKRYIKLAFPLLAFCLIKCIMQCLPGMGSSENITVFNAIKCGVYKILLWGNIDFAGYFWMLNYIMLGGFAVSILSTNIWHFSPKKMMGITSVVIVILLLQMKMEAILYASCFAGALLFFALLALQDMEIKYGKLIFSIVLLMSIFFGAYPTGVVPTNYYRFFNFTDKLLVAPFFWHFVAAILFLTSISQLPAVQRFFEHSVIQKLAEYSFSFFIVHGLGIKIASKIFKKVMHMFNADYVIMSFLFLPVAIAAALILAWFFQRLIVYPFNKWINRLYLKASEGEA